MFMDKLLSNCGPNAVQLVVACTHAHPFHHGKVKAVPKTRFNRMAIGAARLTFQRWQP
jgi:hypothetical protein